MKEVTIFILCGTKNTRLCCEKGLVLFQGKPFIERIIDIVLPISSNIILVTNDTEYDYLKYKKIIDPEKEKGTLGSIFTALQYSNTKYNLILSLDIPLISTELLMELIDKHDEAAEITILSSKSRMLPLIGIYSKKIAPLLQQAIAKNELKLKNFI